jgi:CelD/BcsL family acetyltransferase involved in cellulose biosynthesis
MKAEVSYGSVPIVKKTQESASNKLRTSVREDVAAIALPWPIDEGAGQNVFLSQDWFQNLVDNSLNPRQTVRVFLVEDQTQPGKPVLSLPAFASKPEVFKPRTLSSLTNFYTPFFTPLIAAGCDRSRALQLLALAIAKDSPRWDAVDLRLLDRDSPVYGELVESLKAAGFVVQTYFCSGNWYEPVAGRSYEQYLQGLRSSVRNIARSKAKKIERSGRARLEIVTGAESLAAASKAYEKIYNSSWKVSEPYPQFMPGLLLSFAKAGWLRLGLAYVDEEPAAAQVWFIANGVASIYKIAYDQKFRDLSIGSFLTMHMMHHAIDVEKVDEIDYLTGDDRYKQDWMSRRRERWGVLAMNPRTVKGAAAIVRHLGGRSAKRMVQRIAGRLRPRSQQNQTDPSKGGNTK